MKSYFIVPLFCVFLHLVSAAPFAVTYDPLASQFDVHAEGVGIVRSFVRSRSALPVLSTACYGPVGRSLLTVGVDSSGVSLLCEWDLDQPSGDVPIRCASVGSPSDGSASDVVSAPPDVLVAFPYADKIVAVEYASFAVSEWISMRDDPGLLGPRSLEYDPVGGAVYVALEDADAVRRYAAGDAAPLDSADAPFASLPRPALLVLVRQPGAGLPVLFALTSDATLAELYAFRLGDGASLSVLPDLYGAWSEPTPSSLVLDVGYSALIAAWNESWALEASAVERFSSTDGSDLGDLPRFGTLGFPARVALVRAPPASLGFAGVVDSCRHVAVNATADAEPYWLYRCEPGVASGCTLDGDSLLRAYACSNESLVVVDRQSVYRLDAVGGCFEGYLAAPSTTASEWIDAYYDPAADVLALVGGDWNVSSLAGVCRGAAAPRTPHLIGVLAPYAGLAIGRFSLANGTVACQLRLDGSALLACTNGTFGPISSTSLAGAVGVATAADGSGSLWISYGNGTLIVVDRPASDRPLVSARYYPTTRGVSIDSVVAAEGWVGRVNNNGSCFLLSASLDRANRSVAYDPLIAVASCAATIVAVADLPPLSFAGLPVSESNVERDLGIAGIVSLSTFLIFWIALVVVVIARRIVRRRGPPSRTLRLEGDPRHCTSCHPVRSMVRRLFCWCSCCWDASTGYLRCCYCMLGGRRDASGRYSELDEVGGSAPPYRPAFSVSAENDLEAKRAADEVAAAASRVPSGEPFGDNPTMQTVQLHAK